MIPRQARNDGSITCAVLCSGFLSHNRLCRGALLHKKTPRVRSFFCLRLSILLQNASLFEFDGCADFFELVCHFLGFRFGNVFFNGRRRAVNERFRFGESERRDFTHNLDDGDFVRSDFFEHYRELGLLFRCGSSRAACRGSRRRCCGRSRSATGQRYCYQSACQ